MGASIKKACKKREKNDCRLDKRNSVIANPQKGIQVPDLKPHLFRL